MKILIANDDGITSDGILALAEALAREHDIYVSAPAGQRSGTGHGITITTRVAVEEYDFPHAKKAYMMSGTPADCVKMGLMMFENEGIAMDAVFSGINNGGNIGTDTLYSGTVSAALEGAVCGLPSVAVSINSLQPRHYGLATELALRAARLDFAGIDDKLVLNINVPDLPPEEVKGVKVTGLGVRGYYDWNVVSRDDDGKLSLRYGGRPIYYKELDADSNDVGASQHGYATITPLHFDLTNYPLLDKVRASGVADAPCIGK